MSLSNLILKFLYMEYPVTSYEALYWLGVYMTLVTLVVSIIKKTSVFQVPENERFGLFVRITMGFFAMACMYTSI